MNYQKYVFLQLIFKISTKQKQFSNREHAEHYNGLEWAYNGPGAVTRVLQKICQTNITYEMTPERCWDFTVYPIKTFYPIHHLNTTYFFNSTKSTVQTALRKVKHAPAIHLFNSNSAKYKNKYSDKSALRILAEKNCPKVLSAVPIGEDY